MKGVKSPVQECNTFRCETCSEHPEFEGNPAAVDHLKTVHGVTNFKASRSMVLHLDSADSHFTSYEWIVGEIKLTQSLNVSRKRFHLRQPKAAA